ncbi:hypothetical protein L484_009119 [Morus notabilis]|uniref:Epidermal patterning factor-like protein n=1 Tax=Morus notabilis TaxID=981085 RepID=W9QR86_9ROSA|nr:hypothetical protein L484_009119 [Morus notabilis]
MVDEDIQVGAGVKLDSDVRPVRDTALPFSPLPSPPHPTRGKERVTSLDRVFAVQKRLAGPGSSPPACRSKCGRCSPCKPVHVPIQPGLSIPLEYYPEAWRCKCGNKLFMP